ncbi:hypothetical protein [Qipengyuania sp. JC766]|uniref:hypothetical protein n=1 Tax=Qipengyuania sp. JC766 TaxID=3232139 RepID=UPI003458649A
MALSPTSSMKEEFEMARKPTPEPEVLAADAAATGAGAEADAHESEAKTRFNAALEEAKAGAAALKGEATAKAREYREKAKSQSEGLNQDAKVKAGELANEGKTKVSEGISALGKLVDDNAASIDEKLGPKYGDYARSASRNLHETAAKLDAKSFDELGDDTTEFVRKSPATALGIAAIGGFLLARLLGGRR